MPGSVGMPLDPQTGIPTARWHTHTALAHTAHDTQKALVHAQRAGTQTGLAHTMGWWTYR